MDILISIVVIVVSILIWKLHKYLHGYWKRKGVPYLEPLPIVGNMLNVVLFWKPWPTALVHLDIYKRLAPQKFGGFYNFYRPILLIRDPELIKYILTKDFSHFSDRASFIPNKSEILSRHLFNLTGDEWRSLRTRLSPTFTSGKLKLMFYLMKASTEGLQNLLEKIVDDTNGEVEMRDLMARYTTDVISSCAFGLEANTIENPNSQFRTMGKKVFEVNWRSMIRQRLFLISPQLARIVAPSFPSPDVVKFFVSITKQAVEYREKNNVTRNDFVDLLISIRNEEKKQEENGLKKDPHHIDMTIEYMTAQSFVFFVAGFETSSSALSFALYELAQNIDVQDKAREEVDQVLSRHNGEITYESIMEMKYLEKVVNETLRMYPALPVLFRNCTETYKLPDYDLTIEKGSTVFIPVYGIHYDPQYYPDPMKFNPENFSEEAKSSRPHYTFMPFGEGPRICIGSRFGLMQVKLGLVTILKNFTFCLSDRMNGQVKLKTNTLLTTCNYMWLKCEKREINK